jgi:regulatory protein
MENRITALIVQKRNPERMNVFMDGAFSFSVNRLIGAWLKVGQLISDQRIMEMQSADEVEKAFQSAVHFLSFRSRSEKEILQNLEKKGYSQSAIRQSISKLKDAGLVNDEEFACQWVEARVRSKPRSRRMMEYELRQKKVLDEQIHQAFKGIPDDLTLAFQAARKKMRLFSCLEKEDFRKKMTSFLMRRGFQYDVIRQTLDQIREEMEFSDCKKT